MKFFYFHCNFQQQ